MKKTRRSLFSSIISLLLCFSMLLSTTYAWFTDSAVSESNIIQSGTLDVEMYWSEQLLEPSSSEWKDADGVPIFTYDNWEPGYTDVKYVKVKNAGDLALQWRLSIEAQGEVTKLAEVIDVYYINPVSETVTTLSDKTRTGILTNVLDTHKYTSGVLLPAGETSADYTSGETILAIAFHMHEDAGDEYQGLSIGDGFAISLIATQFSYEGDSFNNSYDNESQWPENVIVGGNSASAPVVPDADNKVSGAVSLLSEDGLISAEVPAGVALKDGVNKLTLSVTDVANSKANVTLSQTEAAMSIDVHINGVAATNDVVMAISMKELLPKGLNMGNYRFYHVENGATVEMILLADGIAPVHNNYEYDPATGDVVLYLKSFSEFALVADNENPWDGKFDYTWYDDSKSELTIANADQLAAFGAIVGGMADGIERDSFDGKTVKLLSDINLGDKESENREDIIFYPIGYWNNEGTYEKLPAEERITAVESGLYAFCGTFDGNGHTIANFYHNTWEMKGDHNWYDPIKEQYYRDGMGLFGRIYGGTVKNLTVKNFSSDGEIATTGVIAAYADGATFENISIFNCNPRVYNIGNGGIVGCVGWYAKEADLKTTFKNITVDNSNKISALWGSYDVACGGIVGQYYPTSGQTSAGTPVNGGISFENCHISAQMDVYNDVCGNYQYYAYRYAGMLIGSVRENVTVNDGVYPKMDGITAENCTVHFGTWNNYYYCEFEKNGHPSYSGPDDYKFSRVPDSEINFTDSNGNGIIDTKEEIESVNGCKHNHSAVENNNAVFLPFNNLVTGYGWGVTTKVVGELEGVTILDRTEGNSVEKFEGQVNTIVNNTTIKLGDIFKFIDNGVKLVPGALTVTITNVDKINNPVSATVDYDRENWANTTITFTGVGEVKITIQDYYFCTPTTITVTINEHEHKYDNACDKTCNVCGGIREVGSHQYDNVCDATCNVCGEERNTEHTASEAVVENNVESNCTSAGSYDSVVYCVDCGDEISRQTITVDAKGHTEGEAVEENRLHSGCETTGSYDSVVYCVDCDDEISRQTITVPAKGHTEVIDEAVTVTCETAGKTEGKHCSACNKVFVAQKTIDALGHIESKFTGDFLYRVGNQNNVDLSSLFNVGKHSVEISSSRIAGNASVTINGTTLTFSGTGIVKVIVTSACACVECDRELTLEVVDAVNATSATSATNNNVVLLNDCGFSSLEVSGGYTLFGNGFTLSCGSDSVAIDRTYSFLELKGGTLDNVKIVVPNFSHSIMYEKNKTENSNPSNTDSSGRTRYYNIRSAILVSATSAITNSYISGGRAAIYLTSGELTVKNSTIYGGAVANIQTEASGHLILEDATLIQEPIKANVNDTSKTVMGLSVVIMCDTNGNGSPITLNGYLHQYAWAHSGYAQYVPSDGQSAVSTVLSKKDFIHSITYSDGVTRDSVNLGFVYIPGGTTNAKTNITDDRSDSEKGKYLYDITEVSALAAIYTYKNTNGTDNAVKEKTTYTSTSQGIVIPNMQYSETNENRVFTTSYNTTEGLWKSTLKVDVDAGVYTFSFAKLLAQKYGNNLNYTITKDGELVDKNATITLNSAISNVYYLTIIDDQIYDKNGNHTEETRSVTYIFELQSTKTSLPAPTWTSTTLNGTPYIVVDSKDSDWNCAVPVLDGLKVKYWSKKQNKEVELDLANVVSAAGLSKGLQNGANNTLTITVSDEYTLTITTTAFKSNDNGKPVVVNGKLYFTVSSSSNYVSTSTTSRTPNISYTFTDANNSDSITLSTSFNVEYKTYKDNQYKYSDFCNGTLTQASSCVTPDTLITLANGTQVRVDSLTGNEELLVWNMETGMLDKAPIMFVDSEEMAEYEIIKLRFSDGTEVKIIYEHGFWDYDLNKYVYLDKNAADYIGHTFAKQNGDSLEKVTLVDVVIENEVTTAWSPVTVGHLCYFVNGMLSMPGGVGGLFNIFEVDPETMTYDYEQIAKDIETYGLYTYEELNAICPLSEEMFNAAGGAYLKISVGKGNLTIDELINMINRYSKYI